MHELSPRGDNIIVKAMFRILYKNWGFFQASSFPLLRYFLLLLYTMSGINSRSKSSRSLLIHLGSRSYSIYFKIFKPLQFRITYLLRNKSNFLVELCGLVCSRIFRHFKTFILSYSVEVHQQDGNRDELFHSCLGIDCQFLMFGYSDDSSHHFHHYYPHPCRYPFNSGHF